MAARSNGQNRGSKVQRMQQADRCLELMSTGQHTLRSIAKELGISHETVRVRIDEACERVLSPKVETLRTVMDEQLDVLAKTAMDSLNQLNDEGEPLHDVHKVIASMLKIMDRKAKLHGLDAPTRVEGSVTVQTQAEAELEQLFAGLDAAQIAALEDQVR